MTKTNLRPDSPNQTLHRSPDQLPRPLVHPQLLVFHFYSSVEVVGNDLGDVGLQHVLWDAVLQLHFGVAVTIVVSCTDDVYRQRKDDVMEFRRRRHFYWILLERQNKSSCTDSILVLLIFS